MKKIKFAVILIALAMVQFSCSKDDGAGDDAKVSETPLTVTEGKTKIESSATDMLNKVDGFRSDQAVMELHELSNFVDQNITQDKSVSNSSSIFRFFLGLGDAVVDGKLNAKSIAAEQNKSMTSDSLWNDYQNETGVYVWSSTLGDFEKIAESQDIDYSISYTVNGVDKSATFLVSNFEVRNISPDADQMVKAVDVSFKVASVEYFNFHLASAYSNYLPTTLTSSLTFGSLSSTLTFSNNGNTNISSEAKITLGDSELFRFTNNATGDFTMLDNGEEVEEEDFPNVYNTVSSELTILNLKLSASAEVATHATWVNNNPDATPQENVTHLNNNSNISISTTGGQAIATGLYYVSLDEWQEQVWDEETQEWVYVTRTDENIDIRFLFDDGTSSDFATYFGEGFQAIEDQFSNVSGSYEDMGPNNL